MLFLITGRWQTRRVRLAALITNGQSKDLAPCWRGQVWHKPHTCSVLLFSISGPSSGYGMYNYRILVVWCFHYSDVHKCVNEYNLKPEIVYLCLCRDWRNCAWSWRRSWRYRNWSRSARWRQVTHNTSFFFISFCSIYWWHTVISASQGLGTPALFLLTFLLQCFRNSTTFHTTNWLFIG